MIFNLSDDGARLLWLEFRGPGGEEELDMGKNPKVIDLRIFNTFHMLLFIDTLYIITWARIQRLSDQISKFDIFHFSFQF